MQPRAVIEEEARRLGFDRIAVASLAPGAPGIEAYDRFITEGRYGDMEWMAQGREPRADPTLLLPKVRSAVVLGVDYAWPRPPDPGGLTGKVASYAWGRDYHNLVGKRVRRLQAVVQRRVEGLRTYVGVDNRPLIERAWAERSGLGFIGKNCLVIVPGQTSYLFLAVMLVSVELEPDLPLGDHCGRCRRCLDVCPTNAFTGPWELDARLCISYLTIEHRGAIPEELRPKIGRWVFGCDACQEVCPHDHVPTASKEKDLAPRPERAWLDLEWVLDAPEDVIARELVGSPLRRPGARGLKRNAAVVLGNLGDKRAIPALERARRSADALVAEHARWALEALGAGGL